MTRQEIADLYCITTKTLKSRLRMQGIDLPRGLVYPKDIKLIFEKLGRPEQIEVKF
jgi:hypothetical protein